MPRIGFAKPLITGAKKSIPVVLPDQNRPAVQRLDLDQIIPRAEQLEIMPAGK
jgi:hypothetical protein